MPELPEVQTTVNFLKPKVLNRTFVGVWSDWKKMIKKPKGFKDFEKDVKNKKIVNIYRRAKNVVFDLSGGYSLLIHQKMTGHLLIGKWNLENGFWKPADKKSPLNDPYNRFIHVLFYLSGELMIGLSDARKFAKIELWKTENLKKELEKLGPEPLEKSFTFKKFREVLKNKRGKIKQVLMIPEVVAGIGNIYASEILWQSKIHPEKRVEKLSEKELELIYKAIKKVLQLGVELGGESFSDYRKPDGSKGDFDTERKAYKREGQKCHRCGEKIKRIKFGGRSSFFCPHCQKL